MPHEISNMAVSTEVNATSIQLFNVTKTYR